MTSVPARPISEGAVPCQYWLAPCPIYMRPAELKKKIINLFFIFTKCNGELFLCFQTADVKMLADLCPCFHQSPTRPNFGRSRVRKFVSFAH